MRKSIRTFISDFRTSEKEFDNFCYLCADFYGNTMKTFLSFFLFIAVIFSGFSQQENPKILTDFIDRIGGKNAHKKFVLVIDSTLSKNGNDTFHISAKNGKPCITGNHIIAVTTGVNWYLNHYAHINLSWNNSVATSLKNKHLPLPQQPFQATASVPYRYYLNYCTFSYSMAFWNWERWEKELDYMALHGINLPLALVGTEVVWKNVLSELNYSDDEIAHFIAGPAFQAWFLMNNLEGWGGKNPQWWYKNREELARKINHRMRELGMKPVLAGYSGMVPSNIQEKKGWKVANPGKWCSFQRPAFLSPTDPHFETISALYYKHLTRLFGKSDFYSIDPFHEGGDTKNIDLPKAFTSIFNAMQKENPNAIWVLQGWQENPRPEALSSIEKGKLLILDLFSEGEPQKKFQYQNHDFVFCMLHNFGGRIGLHGRLEQTLTDFYASLRHKNLSVKGIGATPEGIETNPMLYDALFELPWQEEISAEHFITNYATNRYGKENAKAQQAWLLLKNSVYNCQTAQQGTSESVFCAKPSLNVTSVSAWSTSHISHNTQSVVKAAKLLFEARNELSGENYWYDLTDVLRQALADKGNLLLKEIKIAYEKGDKKKFSSLKNDFLHLILWQDKLLSANKNFRLGKWTTSARSLAKHQKKSEQNWLEQNARTQITTWGNQTAANNGKLRDYSHREWGGLLKDFYYERWKIYFNALEQNKPTPENWYPFEIKWITNFSKSYSEKPTGNTLEIAQQILTTYFSDFN